LRIRSRGEPCTSRASRRSRKSRSRTTVGSSSTNWPRTACSRARRVSTENGNPVGPFPPAVLLKVGPGGKLNELAKGQLSEPGGIVVANNGKVYVTDGVFTGGRHVHVKG
jgi:hypothetical protein